MALPAFGFSLALLTLAGVTLPRPTAQVATPPPAARCCAVEFDGRTLVGTSCAVPAYSESWDGPLLVARNHARRTIWVSYEYEAADGKVYVTPCYELPAGSSLVIDDPAIEAARPREVHVARMPGPGYPSAGFLPRCPAGRAAADSQPEG
jgi:hypothetical protein